jgi:hypothetical protein
MIGSRCGIANPDHSFSIRLALPRCIAESVIQSSVGVLYSGGVSVEHPDARAIHLQRLPVLCLVQPPLTVKVDPGLLVALGPLIRSLPYSLLRI